MTLRQKKAINALRKAWLAYQHGNKAPLEEAIRELLACTVQYEVRR